MRVSVRGLTKIWPGRRNNPPVFALKNMNLDIEASEFFCLLGPSGCGKSTFLQLVAGLEEPTEGEVRIGDGQESEVPLTAMVWQQYALFPWATVLENITFGPEVRRLPKEHVHIAAEKYIKMVHLEGFEDYYPHELSGGMQQRVALGRALINDPKVLLMDEPLASVDAQTRIMLEEEILRIWSATKKTVIYVTHSLDEAVLLADRIGVMTTLPGRIKQIFNVDIERPRDYETTMTPRFADVKATVWKSLKEETLKAYK